MKNLFGIFLMVMFSSENIFGAVDPCKIDPNMKGCLPIDHPNKPVTWEVTRSFSVGLNPESVLALEDKIYVSTMGKETGPIKNGDGDLSRYNQWGQLTKNFKVNHDLHSPMGMSVIGNSLFVVDIDRIVSISTNDGSFQFEISLEKEGVNFLNDIVVINSRYLVVSATNREALYLIDSNAKAYEKLEISIAHPNGLAYDSLHKILYVSGNKRHELGEYGNGSITAIQMKNWNSPLVDVWVDKRFHLLKC